MTLSRDDIEQVIVRKLGGYNMHNVQWWIDLDEAEKEQLLAESSVQFFANAQEVDPAEAAALFAPESAAPSIPELTYPAPGVVPVQTTYIREVVAGPRWSVSRIEAGASEELYVVRGHAAPVAYDLDIVGGAAQLSDDLLLDAFGFGTEMLGTYADAFAHFKTRVFDRELGNRPWRVSAKSIRGTLSSNPFIQYAELESP